jgi:hypothetical protein
MQWWITDGPLPHGEKIAGPFGSFDLAHGARRDLEAERAPETYWIDSDG